MPIKGSRFKTKYFDYEQNIEPQDVIENRVYYDVDNKKIYIADGTQYLFKYYIGRIGEVLAYMGAGHGLTSYYSSMDKVSFSSDSVSNSYFNLTESHSYASRFSSRTFGYVYGGYDGSSYIKDVEKFNIMNPVSQLIFAETTSYAPSGGSASFNSSVIGYIVAGYSGTATTSSIEKVDMSNDSHALSTYYTSIKNNPAGSNSTLNGYVFGGSTSTNGMSTIGKLVFSSESSSQLTSQLFQSASRTYGSNSTIKGYFATGYGYGSGNYFTSTTQSFVFSSESANLLSVYLSQNKHGIGAMNSTLSSYFVGGALDGNRSSSVDKLSFSDESMIQNKFYLSEIQEYPVSIDNADNSGYIFL